jgi:hypothetical protein
MKRLALLPMAILAAIALAQDSEVRWPDAIVQADKRYDEAVAAANAARLRVYQREMEQTTRRADLDLANAIKERMERVSGVGAATQRQSPQVASLVSSMPEKSWRTLNSRGGSMTIQFDRDGSAMPGSPANPWRTWRINNDGTLGLGPGNTTFKPVVVWFLERSDRQESLFLVPVID